MSNGCKTITFRVYDILKEEQLLQFGVFDSVYVAKLDEPTERSSGWFSIARWTRCGWPLLSLDGGRWSTLEFNESKGRHKFVATFHKTAIPVNPVALLGDLEYLPLRPIWPGFTINTIFYAAILWMLWSSPFVVWRLIRRKRGLCVACGYDLRHADHDACPECGAAGGPAVAAHG